MFGINPRLEAIEHTLKTEIRQKDHKIEMLERRIRDLTSWGHKWREKAKFLRRVRKDLAEKLKLHGETSS